MKNQQGYLLDARDSNAGVKAGEHKTKKKRMCHLFLVQAMVSESNHDARKSSDQLAQRGGVKRLLKRIY